MKTFGGNSYRGLLTKSDYFVRCFGLVAIFKDNEKYIKNDMDICIFLLPVVTL